MRRQKDITKPVTFTIPISLLGRMGKLTEPSQRSKFAAEALRAYLAQCEKEAEESISKYQLPLIERITQ